MSRGRTIGAFVGCLLLAGALAALRGAPLVVSGSVLGEDGPVTDAVVRVQTTERLARTDRSGRFVLSLEGLGAGPHPLTGWAPGFYCAGPFQATAGEEVTLNLRRHTREDHPEYEWLPATATATPSAEEGEACAVCHSREGTDLPYALPFDEWRLDAHARSAVNPRFLTLYLGTDVHGNRSPPTRRFVDRDYGELPLTPDPDRPYYGPGYKTDFPESAGNCAACHVPVAAADAPYAVDPTDVHGIAAEGVTCDFCHKVGDVILDPETGLPWPNRPGVLSFEFLRPPEGEQLFLGPFDDVAPGDDAALPLQLESRFCAPCHHGVFWGTVIYDSYGEWLASPWADPSTGKTCQDCHMPPNGAPSFARPDKGGLRREHTPIPGHRMGGADDRALLRETLTLRVTATWEAALEVEVSVTNDGAGHHVPTDSPLRQVILVVEATDEAGLALERLAGPVVPDWGGRGTSERAYAERPGRGFAKILREEWTFVSPTAAYWNPTRIVADTRIPACDSATDRWSFAAPEGREATVRATLLFRRAFLELETQKGWDLDDWVMGEIEVRVARGRTVRSFEGRPRFRICDSMRSEVGAFPGEES